MHLILFGSGGQCTAPIRQVPSLFSTVRATALLAASPLLVTSTIAPST
ncbi:MAG TPA: hypothetical protein PLL81_05655 [Bacillota bacterium]|nr:hypothetical protein [Bacillota bacterium]